MSLFVPFKRATLLIPSGPAIDPDRKHLFVLLSDPIEAPGFEGKQVLLVNIATVPNDLNNLPCKYSFNPFAKFTEQALA